MTTQQKNFWNNWDFKTILVILQLIGVIWLVATTYASLEAKVESNKAILGQEVERMKDDIKQIKSDVSDIHKMMFKHSIE